MCLGEPDGAMLSSLLFLSIGVAASMTEGNLEHAFVPFSLGCLIEH